LSATQVLVPTPLQPISTENAPPVAGAALTNDDAPYDSESDLSEVAIPVIEEHSPAASTNRQPEFGAQGTEDSESSAADAQGESDDADFDVQESPAVAAANGERHDRSTSIESRRPAKRKIGIEEDEYILANPELYGLRRSVRWLIFQSAIRSANFLVIGSSSTTPDYCTSSSRHETCHL
jgi:chromodomain-helicase-DNA-binding protein 1